MQQQKSTISRKIILSYLLIVLLASAAISVLYKGINNITQIDSTVTKPNDKLKKINQILTLVYEAENYSRSYFIFRSDSILREYIVTNKKISDGIDSLKKLCISNEKQVTNLGEIALLLKQKEDIIQRLETINQNSPQEVSYARVLEEVYFNTYESFDHPLVIRESSKVKRDSIFELIEQTGFLKKVKKIFSPDPIPEQKVFRKVSIEESTSYDTLYNSSISSDSIINTIKRALTNFKNRNEFAQKQFVSQETGLLHSDKIMLDRIRALMTSLETEEIEFASKLIGKSQEIIKQSTFSIILLGSLAFILVLVFLFIIYRDIDISRKYQTELQKARMYSDDLVRLKEQFVANMSHEMRTPLTTIIGFAEQLKKTEITEDQKDFVQNIEHSSKHLHGLINNVLDLSKSNAGKIFLEKTIFNIVDVINEIQQVFSVEAKNKGLIFRCANNNQYSEYYLKGDPFRLKQVLLNIVGNAIKFTEKGFVALEYSLNSISDTDDLLEIVVSDSGIGIPENKITTIFDEFTQADADTTRKFGGSGLGLSISKKIVDLMQGSIKVESTVMEGSKFVIQIPIQRSEKLSLDNENDTLNLKIPQNKKILVVDDDEPIRLLLKQIFSKHEIRCDFAASSQEALNLLNSDYYNLVLTDIQMPGISGLELIEVIHQRINPDLPVIALTANMSISDNIKKAGFAGHIAKPFTESSLFQSISEFTTIIVNTNVQLTQEKKREPHNGYSFVVLKEFTGDDNESLLQIIQSFVLNASEDIKAIEQGIQENNFEKIAGKVHKMLPMFRQLKIDSLIDEMQMLERYKELNIEPDDITLFAENFVKNAKEIIEKISAENISV